MAAHPDIQAEQAHIDRAYARLDAMRAAAASMHDAVIAMGRGGTPQAREERDVIVHSSLQRLERLNIGRESLCFGRIDRHGGERFYIGRLPVSDEDQEPLVVDWRAPVAEPFYRATGRHRMGLVRRRHFITDGARLVGIEDELFDLDHASDEGLGLVGEGALLAALERSRAGPMRDIVATIQREQDEIIRAPLPGVIVVQGGPGTGKTAVALHRAAYLLYTFRFPLERQGVLVVGPNPLFLRYIEQVLPSLGETGVGMTTVSGLLPGVDVRGKDTAAAARVKGDGRMAKVIGQAVRDRQRPLPRDAIVPFGAANLTLSTTLSATVVAAVRRRPGPHNARRRQVDSLLVKRLHEQHNERLERARRTGLRGGEVPDPTPAEDFAEALREEPAFVAALDRMWPLLSPQELVHDLFGAPALLKLAANGLLDDAEQAALRRPRSRHADEVAWTAEDVPLLDEASVHLGPRRSGAKDADNGRSFGHVVVDEAQDLSPMQLRMLARRSLSGSMTVVGDLGQASGHWAPASWDDVVSHLPLHRPPRVVELSVNYRTPAEIMEVASRVLAAAAPDLEPPTSVRSTGTRPKARPVPRRGLPAAVAEQVAKEMADEMERGSVAVICPESLATELEEAVRAAGLLEEASDHGWARVSVVPVGTAKGLEFDSVIVVEPARLVREAPQGLRALYVAMTRPTKRLTLLHSEALPPELDGLGSGEEA